MTQFIPPWNNLDSTTHKESGSLFFSGKTLPRSPVKLGLTRRRMGSPKKHNITPERLKARSLLFFSFLPPCYTFTTSPPPFLSHLDSYFQKSIIKDEAKNKVEQKVTPLDRGSATGGGCKRLLPINLELVPRRRGKCHLCMLEKMPFSPLTSA